MPRGGTLPGALFESLVTLGVRDYARAAEARVGERIEALRVATDADGW